MRQPHTFIQKLKGFTLIELLIVVAIIAILAAIAVPNFLEAQTRAKVSRVKSDMRSSGIAMEAYHIDNNEYILTSGQIRLTTPIAYITSWTQSPFSETPEPLPAAFVRWEFLETVRPAVTVTTDTAGGLFEPFTHAGAPVNCGNCENRDFYVYQLFQVNLFPSPSDTLYAATFDRTRWNMKSVGPDNRDSISAGQAAGDSPPIYDPTNGTTSDGDILYYGPGYGFGDI
jgi:prepilin-type N-terminal cleavage/methylation domain-containing protein